ncbi:MAG: hypothetical protein H0W64_07630 [Gammaproteobacteria bacterium]|nr:hypothetical protein [Gammaproteobacteria bacterium]
MGKRTIEIVIDDKKINALALPSGGTKTIYDIGDGYVIARMGGDDALIDSEMQVAHKFKEIGLYTQDYDKLTAIINGNPEPVLKMKNFKTLATEGKQVRDRKNRESSCGDSFIFNDLEHFKNKAHWRNVLKYIADDIFLYLINNLGFGSDAFNLIIVDTKETEAARHNTRSKLFSDIEQEIHLYFFDFGSSVYTQEKIYDFIDAFGDISVENIRMCINNLSVIVTDSLFHGVLDAEYKNIMQKPADCMMILNLMEASKEIFKSVWDELVDNISARIENYLNNIPLQERKDQYLTPHMHSIAEQEAKHAEIMRKIYEDNNRMRAQIEESRAKLELWRHEALAEQARLDAINKTFENAKQTIETKFEPKEKVNTENPRTQSRCSIQ